MRPALIAATAIGALNGLLTVVLRDDLVDAWAADNEVRLEGLAADTITPPAFVPVAILAPHGLWSSISGQLSRPLEVESLGASLVEVLHEGQDNEVIGKMRVVELLHRAWSDDRRGHGRVVDDEADRELDERHVGVVGDRARQAQRHLPQHDS